MNQGVGYKCPRCKEVQFGLEWHLGVRVLYSKCICGGELHRRLIPLEEAIQFLGSEKTDEETREAEALEPTEVTTVH